MNSSFGRTWPLLTTQSICVLGVDAYIGSDQRQEQMLRRSHRPDAYFLAGELGNAADRSVHEYLEAADMHPGQRLHCNVMIDASDEHMGVVQTEIDLTLRD